MTEYGHSSFEVVDADAVGMGQRVLLKRGWRHAWGIGRHILGSQIFDYWEDPWGASTNIIATETSSPQPADRNTCPQPGSHGTVGSIHAEKLHKTGNEHENLAVLVTQSLAPMTI